MSSTPTSSSSLDLNKTIALGVLGVTTVGSLAALALYLLSKKGEESDEEEEGQSEGEEEEETVAEKQSPKPVEPEDPIMARVNDLKTRGNTAFRNSDFQEAIDLYTEALAIPGVKDAHLIHSNRSVAYYYQNKFKEALEDAQKCVDLEPTWQKGYFRKAKALHAMEKYDEAFMSIYQGILIQSGNQELEQLLQSTRSKLGPCEKDQRATLDQKLAAYYYQKVAEGICNDTLKVPYKDIEAIVLEAVAQNTITDLLDHEKIHELYEQHPVEVAQVVVEILLHKGVEKASEAFSIAQKVREDIPQPDARVYLLLINSSMRTLQSTNVKEVFIQGIKYCREGLKLEPQNVPLSHMYAALLTNFFQSPGRVCPVEPREALKELTVALNNPDTNHLIIADTAIRIWFRLFDEPETSRQLLEEEERNQRLSIPEDEAYIYGLTQGAFSKILMEKSFLTSLAKILFNNPAIEKILSPFRKSLLTLAPDSEEFSKVEELIYAIALQQWRSGYVWYTTSEGIEVDKVHQLVEEVEGMLSTDVDSVVTDGVLDKVLHHHLAMIALYRPLFAVKNIGVLAPKVDLSKAHPWFAEIFKKNVLDHLEEQEIQKSIKELTRVPESELKDFYNSFTPSWDDAGFYAGRLTKVSIVQELSWTFPDFKPTGEFRKILFAGCGSGQEIYQAYILYEGIEITGIDISITNLAYAVRQNKELGVQNVNFYLADIMSLDQSAFEEGSQEFDMIIANSVIHHLPDPMEGMRRLCALLRPGGLLKVSVYNREYIDNVVKDGRKFLAQEFNPKAFDTSTSPPKIVKTLSRDELREARNKILDSKNEDMQMLAMLPGFYHMDEFKEMLFHPSVTGYTFRDIGQGVQALKMNLVGIEFPGITQETVLKYRVEHPDDPELTNTEHLHAFALKHPGAFSNFTNHTTYLLEKPVQ